MDGGTSRDTGTDLLIGFALCVLLHLAGQGTAFLVIYAMNQDDSYAGLTAMMPIFGIGLTQLVYVLPVAIGLHARNTPSSQGKAKGIWLCAAITFLLNGACFGYLAFLG
jgi:hypothetical protein